MDLASLYGHRQFVEHESSDIDVLSSVLSSTNLQSAIDEVFGLFGHGWTGDGSDGAVTLTGNVTHTRDTLYSSLDTAGFTLTPSGTRIFVTGTLTNTGLITANGNPGGNSTGVASGAGGAGTGGVQVIGIGAQGGNGAVFPSTNGSSGGIIGSNVIGGLGGAGANDTVSGVGGSGGTGPAPVATQGGFRFIEPVVTGHLVTTGIGSYAGRMHGGTGGGGGGGANMGGGGGGGAGFITISAQFIVNASGTISANGGAGGDGASTGGGGGGGGGGAILVRCQKFTGNAPTATGGAKGSGGAGGTGSAGAGGTVVVLQ